MIKKIISIAILFILFGCDKEKKYPESKFWMQSEPKDIPDIHVFLASKEPEWKSKVTVLVGEIPRNMWQFTPFSLRRLCKEIPTLSERVIIIYSKESDYASLNHISELAIYHPESHYLAFNGGDSSWPLRIYLGKNWCK